MSLKKKTVDIFEAINLAMQPSDENFSILLSYFFVWFKPVWLKTAIKDWTSPREVLQNYVSGTYSILTKKILQLWWEPWLNDFLSDANKVYNYLSKDPELKKLLDTAEGRKYLNYAVKEIYEWAYEIAST
ncbi:MAG: hypothetical protein ACPLVI_06105 [Thermoplasmata archaeon]